MPARTLRGLNNIGILIPLEQLKGSGFIVLTVGGMLLNGVGFFGLSVVALSRLSLLIEYRHSYWKPNRFRLDRTNEFERRWDLLVGGRQCWQPPCGETPKWVPPRRLCWSSRWRCCWRGCLVSGGRRKYRTFFYWKDSPGYK